MYIIAGLGNPGRQYEGTRHNMGFDTVDELIERNHIPQSGVKFHAMYGKGKIAGQDVILMKPLSYMNLSGGPIRDMVHFFKIDPARELIVICDDIDLDPGRLRIRSKGSAGGHNGLKDIIAQLGTDAFTRVRIGVGAKPAGWDLADYVLGRFSGTDRKLVDEAILSGAMAVEKILSEGVDAAMNAYNRAPARPKPTKPKKASEQTPQASINKKSGEQDAKASGQEFQASTNEKSGEQGAKTSEHAPQTSTYEETRPQDAKASEYAPQAFTNKETGEHDSPGSDAAVQDIGIQAPGSFGQDSVS